MIKVRIKLSLLLFIFIVTGCNKQSEWEVYNIPINNLIHQDDIIYKEINQIIRPDFISKSGNKILVLSSVSDTIIHEYDLEMSYVRNWGKKGHGPNEVSNFLMFCEGDPTDESLYLWGFNPVMIYKYSQNTNNIFEKEEVLQLPYYAAFNYLNITKDSCFIYLDIDKLQINKINLKTFEEDKIEFKIDKDDRSSAFYSNRGVMATNSKYIIYAYMYKNQIDIYDKDDLTLKKRYIINDNGYKPKENNYNLIRYYTHVVSTDEYIYAYKVDSKERHSIEIFDFKGKNISKNILSIPIPLYTVDENNKSIIGFNYSDENLAFIYKY